MNDFLLALGITVLGGFVMGKMDSSRTLGMQQQSCTQQGGQWQSSGCIKGGQPINTQYTSWGPTVDLGLPVAAAVLATRSGGGLLGTVVGAGAVFFIAISEIH
jgi:hypothetical protein